MLATMHGKEVAIAPALRERLGLIVEVAEGIDTDRLGTFTGEIPRAGTIEEAAIAKARLGMAVAKRASELRAKAATGRIRRFPSLAPDSS
ncbi:MAG: hypothetical protein R3D62_08665 [Xanthobacteraceae bacterium]